MEPDAEADADPYDQDIEDEMHSLLWCPLKMNEVQQPPKGHRDERKHQEYRRN